MVLANGFNSKNQPGRQPPYKINLILRKELNFKLKRYELVCFWNC